MSNRRKAGAVATAAIATVSGAMWFSPPADGQEMSATATTAFSKIAANQPLTAEDKMLLGAQVKSVAGITITDQDLGEAFTEYEKGNSKALEVLPTHSDVTMVTDAPMEVTGTQAAALNSCTGKIAGITISRNLYGGVSGARLATFRQHVEITHNCECVYPPANKHELSNDVTGNGSYGGWSFTQYNDARTYGLNTKYGNCWFDPIRDAQEWYAQAQFDQNIGPVHINWDPAIKNRQHAKYGCPDHEWWTDVNWSQVHNECISIWI